MANWTCELAVKSWWGALGIQIRAKERLEEGSKDIVLLIGTIGGNLHLFLLPHDGPDDGRNARNCTMMAVDAMGAIECHLGGHTISPFFFRLFTQRRLEAIYGNLNGGLTGGFDRSTVRAEKCRLRGYELSNEIEYFLFSLPMTWQCELPCHRDVIGMS